MTTVLCVSPHPDDELLGAPATLMALRDQGWRVVNLACGLGRPLDRERRRAELVEACRRAGFELLIPGGLPPIGRGAEAGAAPLALATVIGQAVVALRPSLIVGPSPHDGHHGHELVGRAIVAAVEAAAQDAVVAFWGLWGELPLPNLLVPFGEGRLAEIAQALSAHEGELARNRFDALLPARARAAAVLGPERVLGFGAAGLPEAYAELLTLVAWNPEPGWRLLPSLVLEADRSHQLCDLGALEGAPEIGWWLHEPSVRARLRGDCGS